MNLQDRAKALLLSAAAPAIVTSAQAASLSLDYVGSGLYDNSGFFVSSAPLASAGGTTQGTGFKLFGTDTIADSVFYRTDSEGRTRPRSDGDGLGMIWGGAINGTLTEGTTVVAPYEFSFNYTHTPANEFDSPQVTWDLIMGFFDSNGNVVDFSSDTYFAIEQSNDTVRNSSNDSTDVDYNIPGAFDVSGNLEYEFFEDSPVTHWFVILNVLVQHENDARNFDGPFGKRNGDTLTVTVPENSIDIAVIPEPSSMLLGAAGLIGGLAIRRRER